MMLLLGTKFWSWAVLHPTRDVQNDNWKYENMTSINTTSTQTTFICVDIITVFCSFKPCFGPTLSINIEFKFTVKLKAFTKSGYMINKKEYLYYLVNGYFEPFKKPLLLRNSIRSYNILLYNLTKTYTG